MLNVICIFDIMHECFRKFFTSASLVPEAFFISDYIKEYCRAEALVM